MFNLKRWNQAHPFVIRIAAVIVLLALCSLTIPNHFYASQTRNAPANLANQDSGDPAAGARANRSSNVVRGAFKSSNLQLAKKLRSGTVTAQDVWAAATSARI